VQNNIIFTSDSVLTNKQQQSCFNKLSGRLIDVSEFIFVLMHNIIVTIRNKSKSEYVRKIYNRCFSRDLCLDKRDRIIQLSRDM
jgi:phosphopantetheine adenylyltransferase